MWYCVTVPTLESDYLYIYYIKLSFQSCHRLIIF